MARKPKAEPENPLQWAEKYRARPLHDATASIYCTSLAEADAYADDMKHAGWRVAVEQLYGPVYTIPLVRQNRERST